jgi:hypothetical protein
LKNYVTHKHEQENLFDICVEYDRGPCTIQHKLHAVYGSMVLCKNIERVRLATHKRQTL